MNILRALFPKMFKRKGYLLDNKYEIVPAFEWAGETYYMHKDPLNTLSGRGLTSLVFMEEMLMRCDISYLRDHVAAFKRTVNNGQGININAMVQLNTNLEERINLLAAIPDHVYKLASVTFFTKHESPFKYDMQTGQQKIKAWKEAPGMYDFFLQTPLKDLIPSLALPDNNSVQYLMVLEKINDLHLSYLREVLSNDPLTAEAMN